MNRATLKKITAFVALFLLSFLLLQFVWRVSAANNTGQSLAPEKINLALRRTAHFLLAEAGDSSTRIAPVAQIGSKTWLVRLERSFNYDRVPELLQASFDLHDIHENYDVAVLRCADGELQLGYNILDYLNDNNVPCSGRDIVSDCNNLQVTFSVVSKNEPTFPLEGWGFSAFLAVGLYLLSQILQRMRAKKASIPLQTVEWLSFGNSRLDIGNQVLECGAARHHLTYREAKLLQLFGSRPNQLLERNYILENVWADEGILVGRSVDVFVSRLRKLLRNDPSVGLVAVHGVGYRLEVVS